MIGFSAHSVAEVARDRERLRVGVRLAAVVGRLSHVVAVRAGGVDLDLDAGRRRLPRGHP